MVLKCIVDNVCNYLFARTIQYNTIRFIKRRIQIIVNISSFELFTDNKYNTTRIGLYVYFMALTNLLFNILCLYLLDVVTLHKYSNSQNSYLQLIQLIYK